MKQYRSLIITATLMLAALAAGCVSSGRPVHQYTLETIRSREQPRLDATDIHTMILVGPINLPRQYTGRAIVTRTGPAVIKSSATHLWAAPLEDQIAATMVQDLAILLKSDTIAVFPGPRFGDKKWQLVLDVKQFSGSPNKDFTCSLIWTINDLAARKIVQRKNFTLTVPVGEDSFRAYVTTASAALAALSRELAPVLAEIASK